MSTSRKSSFKHNVSIRKDFTDLSDFTPVHSWERIVLEHIVTGRGTVYSRLIAMPINADLEQEAILSNVTCQGTLSVYEDISWLRPNIPMYGASSTNLICLIHRRTRARLLALRRMNVTMFKSSVLSRDYQCYVICRERATSTPYLGNIGKTSVILT